MPDTRGTNTTTTPPPVGRRASSVVVVDPDVRSHRQAVIAWALANKLPVNRDVLAALLGARLSVGMGPDQPWTGTDIGSLLWVGISEWCQSTGAAVPDGDVATTLRTYLRFLSAHRMLGRGSDTPADLRRAITEYGGTSPRSSRHPSMRQPLAPVVPLA